MRGGLGGHLDPDTLAGGQLAGGDGVKGGRLRAGGEKEAWTRVREEEGHHLSRTVSRMDTRPGRVVATAGRAAESGQLNFWIPGGTESGRAQGVCVSWARETAGPGFLCGADCGGRGPTQHLFCRIAADLLAPDDRRYSFQLSLAFPNPVALKFGVLASAIKGIIQNSILSK